MICSWNEFLSSSGLTDRSEPTSDYSPLLAGIIQLNVWTILSTEWFVFVVVHLTQAILLTSQSTDYLMPWIKLAIVWDFCPPHLSAPFSQVPLPLEQWHHFTCNKSSLGLWISSNFRVLHFLFPTFFLKIKFKINKAQKKGMRCVQQLILENQ